MYRSRKPEYAQAYRGFESHPLRQPACSTGDEMTETFKLSVNGIEHAVTAEADTPLLYILRNDLQLKGTQLWLRTRSVRRRVTPASVKANKTGPETSDRSILGGGNVRPEP